MAAMSEAPFQAADDDDYYDYTGDALKADEPEEELGDESDSLASEAHAERETLEAGVDETTSEDDGTGLHTSEELMDEQWDNDLR